MTALDAARARAEIEIRKFFSADFQERRDYWYAFDGDDEAVPRFYHKARDYVRSIYPVYLESHFKADTEVPLAAVSAARDFALETARYLWAKHGFESQTFLWNAFCYPDVLETWKVKPEPLQFDDFWDAIWTEAPSGERPLCELYRDAVDGFWKSLTDNASPRDTVQPIFAKRAAWVCNRLGERRWDHNRPAEFGGPDRKTMKRILAGFPVNDGTLEKLLTALNKIPNGKVLKPRDIPDN